MQHWILSPRVGEITDLKVKITFELRKKDLDLYYRVRNINYLVYMEPIGPTSVLLAFDDPGPQTIVWMVDNDIIYHHTITIGDIKHLHFVSCDFLEADAKHSLWRHMDRYLLPNTAIVHLGDQAYMDRVFRHAQQVYRQLGQSIDNEVMIKKFRDYVYHQYGKRYAETWQSQHHLLGCAANYYLWDDHEIANNICLTNDYANDVRIIAEAAEFAYIDYQLSFRINNDFILYSYSWCKRLNEDTIMMAVERISRRIPLSEVLEFIGTITNYRRLILCFSSAPIPRPHGIYGYLYHSVAGWDKFWDPDDVQSLYKYLFGLNKEIIVVGGDLHFGLHGVVKCKNQEIQVMIASPITNQPTPDRYLAAKGMRGRITIGDMMFKTLKAKARRCYGTIDLESWKTRMIWSFDIKPKNTLKYYKTLSKF